MYLRLIWGLFELETDLPSCGSDDAILHDELRPTLRRYGMANVRCAATVAVRSAEADLRGWPKKETGVRVGTSLSRRWTGRPGAECQRNSRSGSPTGISIRTWWCAAGAGPAGSPPSTGLA